MSIDTALSPNGTSRIVPIRRVHVRHPCAPNPHISTLQTALGLLDHLPPCTLKQRLSSSTALHSTLVPDFLSVMQNPKNTDAVASCSKSWLCRSSTRHRLSIALSDARDSAGALWWMLVEKAIGISGLNSPDQNNQGPGYLTWGSLRIQTRKEKVLEERGERTPLLQKLGVL